MPTGPGVKTYVLTLTGGQDNLATLAGLVKGGTALTEPAFRELHFEAEDSNANAILVGSADLTIADGNYGFKLPAGATLYSKALGVGSGGGSPLKLSSFVALGTAGQKLLVVGVQ
jgi:hypothetical protein